MSTVWNISPPADTGLGSHRLASEHSARERVFADVWREWNGRDRFSGGILDCLVLGDQGPDRCPTTELGFQFERRVKRRERAIVATVIQWLGTNVGTGFLSEVLRRSAGLRQTLALRAADEIESDRIEELRVSRDALAERCRQALKDVEEARRDCAEAERKERQANERTEVALRRLVETRMALAQANVERDRARAALAAEQAKQRLPVPFQVNHGPRKLILP